MNITQYITKALANHKDSGCTPTRVVCGLEAVEGLYDEFGYETNSIYGIPIEIDDSLGLTEVVICTEEQYDFESLRTECPNCQCLSYENGYCYGCGMYRGDNPQSEEHDDLCDLISKQGEALKYGFSLIEEEEYE